MMKTRHSITAAMVPLAMTGTALAENEFQLPRECLDRQNVDPDRCVIPDGPPRLPRVRKVPAGLGSQAAGRSNAEQAHAGKYEQQRDGVENDLNARWHGFIARQGVKNPAGQGVIVHQP